MQNYMRIAGVGYSSCTTSELVVAETLEIQFTTPRSNPQLILLESIVLTLMPSDIKYLISNFT